MSTQWACVSDVLPSNEASMATALTLWLGLWFSQYVNGAEWPMKGWIWHNRWTYRIVLHRLERCGGDHSWEAGIHLGALDAWPNNRHPFVPVDLDTYTGWLETIRANGK